MGDIDAAAKVQLDEEVFTAGIELARRHPVAVPEGPAHRQGHRREARRERGRPDGVPAPAADLDSFEAALVITDYEGGLPPIEEQPVPCDSGEGGVLPSGEVPCYTPSPAPHQGAHRAALGPGSGSEQHDPACRRRIARHRAL